MKETEAKNDRKEVSPRTDPVSSAAGGECDCWWSKRLDVRG